MKRILLAAALVTVAQPVLADGYIMGSGRWSCADAIRVYETGTPIEKGQLAGWIMGFWSAATFNHETSFVDTVERAGGLKIADATVAECRKADPGTPIYRVAQGMIANTK